MQYKSLGKCGTQVSKFSLGGWTTFGGSVQDQQATRDIIQAAYTAGINFFDIADIYAQGQAEIEMGKVLKDFKRHTLVISSKVFWPMSEDINDRGLSRKHLFESVEKSLKRVGTDYLDIYFCHRFDENTPLEETVRAMDDLIRQGKVLYWGTSMWTAEQIKAAQTLCEKHGYYRPQVEQPEYNLFSRQRIEKEIAPAVVSSGMGMVVWSPLASGLLTGKYDGGTPTESRLSQIAWLGERLLTPANLEKSRQFSKIAKDLDVKPAVLALAWAGRKDFVSSVILGATKVEQLKENLRALELNISSNTESAIDRIFPT